jgi:beta-galactosidase
VEAPPADQSPHEENVEVYTNASEVELFLNDRSLGRKSARRDIALNWKVPFAPGTLKAVALKEGKEVASDLLRTAGQPAKLVLSADKTDLTASWDDIAHVEVRVTDANGTVVPAAANMITFAIGGPGAILGVDNGSIVSHEPFLAPGRSAHQGRALALVRATAGQGKVTLRATAEGLVPAEVELRAMPGRGAE